MKVGALATATAAIALAAWPTAASAGATQYYVTKFEGKPAAKLTFAIKSGKLDNAIYQAPLSCPKVSGRSLMAGEAKDARVKEGRFASRTTYGPNEAAVALLRGRGFPASPNGFLRARFEDSGTCKSGRLHWTAHEVTVDAWRKYRRHQMGLSH